jgi:hypothetical protein
MAEGTITCPHCHQPFELTAAMSASIEASLRAKIEADANKRKVELDARERAIAEKSAATERAKASVDEEVANKLASERMKLTEQLKKQAQQEASLEVTTLQERLQDNQNKLEAARQREEGLLKREQTLEDRQRTLEREVQERLKAERAGLMQKAKQEATEEAGAQLAALQEELGKNKTKLADAQKAELDLRKQKQSLEEEKREFELEKQRAIDAARAQIQEKAQKDAAEEFRLKTAEKDKLISDMQRQVEELKRKAEQGSQQLQGEVQELDLETTLRSAFPKDSIEPVPKGTFGGDTLHRIAGPLGNPIGTILWESKRTKAWSDGWLGKLRGDQRDAKAEICAIVTATLPKGIDSFGQMEGVWVCDMPSAVPLALVLRYALIEVSTARQASEGKQTKMELVYSYLTGPSFRQRVEAIKEAFESMREDLEAEKKVIQKQWAKRDKQIEAVIANTVGMYGDLQGIAGKSMPEIAGLGLKALGDGGMNASS